jgi:N-methylhydantoinase A
MTSQTPGQHPGHHRVAIDIGGTFTDCVVVDERSGQLEVIKVPTTPADPSVGFLNALDRVVGQYGVAAADISLVMHATTVATNTILEGKLARTAFVVTRGFADLLDIARQIRPRLYDLDAMKPAPLVPRELCFEVSERLDSDGAVVEPLSLADIDTAIAAIAEAGVETIVVCLLHSYLNPQHELLVAERIRAALPDLFVSASSEVCPQMGEYARACTALVNAGLVPHVSGYFRRISAALDALGITASLNVMKSDGGLMPVELVVGLPMEIIESGPAAGVIGVAELARRLDFPRVVCFDMGGTTAKAGLLIDGEPILTPSFEVGSHAVAGDKGRGSGYPIRAPMVDLVEVGAGGGSIAWIDSGGILRVGPQSAGANPGPACYGKGATVPTVTDANVALGRIDPDYFLGGEITLDRGAAWKAIDDTLARPLGISVPAAALGILEVANATMLSALRMVSVQRGFDPRGFTMVCTGGAAGLQADVLMKQLGVAATLLPPSPGVGTARGMLFADVRREFRATHFARLDTANIEAAQGVIDELTARARVAFATIAAPDAIELSYAGEVRFLGQSHQFLIGIPGGRIGAGEVAQLAAAFRAAHTRMYGFASETEPVELVELVVTATSPLAKPRVSRLEPGDGAGAHALKGTREVWFAPDAPTATAIYARALLGAGDTITGPAIVEAPDSTILVGIGSRALVDENGNILISVDTSPATVGSRVGATALPVS